MQRKLKQIKLLVLLDTVLWYSFSTAQGPIDQLSNVLTNSQDITSIWAYKDLFPDLKSLNLSMESLHAGIAVDGKRTRQGIKKMLESALNNRNVNWFVLGGSVTLGADLGKGNVNLTFHHALADWWNKTVGKVTGSHMIRKIVAVGGVGTTYFGHCWQEYVGEGDSYDFVTWEFAINDPDSLQYDKAVERFARDTLSLASKPGLIFVNFLSKTALKKKTEDTCRRHEEEAKIVDFIAKTYSSTSFRWERIICHENKDNSNLDVETLFTKNHPKVIGHAQIAYLLINYFRTVLLESMSSQKRNSDSSASASSLTVDGGNSHSDQMPKTVFLSHDEIYSVSRCYTSVSPGPFNPPKRQLKELNIVQNNGFTMMMQGSQWQDIPEQRFDSTGGYITNLPNKKLKLSFNVHHSSNSSKARVSVAIRRKYFGGKVKFVLNEGANDAQIVYADSSEKEKAGVHSVELGEVNQGSNTLTIYTVTGGCNFCALIID